MNNFKLTQSVLQHPTNLIFAVTGTDIVSLLTVLKMQTVTIADYTIQFAIIGESHCITLFHQGEFVLQEVLACTDIPDILQADSHKFAKLEPYQYQRQGYKAHVWFTNSMQHDHWQHHDDLALDFPEMFGCIPFTKIQWKTSKTNIQWRTIHVYPLPTQITYVYTETFFDLTERNNNERINRTNA